MGLVTIFYCLVWYSPHLEGQVPVYPWALGFTQLEFSHITTDSQSVSQSVSMSWCWAPSGSHDQMFVTVDDYCCVFVGCPLWREVGSVKLKFKFMRYCGRWSVGQFWCYLWEGRMESMQCNRNS
jgi:hypothetical protein